MRLCCLCNLSVKHRSRSRSKTARLRKEPLTLSASGAFLLRLVVKTRASEGVGANLFAKTVAQAMHVRRLGDPFADKSAPTPVGQNQKRPSARGVGANLFAKTVVQAMHVRKAWRPLRRQVRSYARWAESKTAFCPRGRGELVREDGRSGDACSKAWRPLRRQVRSYARWAESKRPPARGVGANLFAKTVVLAMHVRKAWRPLRGQVRSYARWAESKRPPARGVGANFVREDGLSSDALSGSLAAPLRPLFRSFEQQARERVS